MRTSRFSSAPAATPHTQGLTTKDTEAVDAADLVVWTSHDMEHKMMDHFDKMGEKQLPAGEAIPEQDLLPWEEDGKIEGHDPHVWNSPKNWQYVVTNIGDKLSKVDAKHAEDYKKNAKAYNDDIQKTNDDVKAMFNKVPKERRVLISAHDAFNYLGRDFGIEVHATDLVSTEGEKSAKDLEDVVNVIVNKKVPTIFADNTVPKQAVDSLKEKVEAKGGHVEVSKEDLFADSLSESAPTDTYLGAFRHNAEVISKALAK